MRQGTFFTTYAKFLFCPIFISSRDTEIWNSVDCHMLILLVAINPTNLRDQTSDFRETLSISKDNAESTAVYEESKYIRNKVFIRPTHFT